MKLTIGILTWGSPKTFTNSNESWHGSGLFDIADEIITFHQELVEKDGIEYIDTAKYKTILSPTNVGIAQGYKRLVDAATSDLFLFLENDWPIAKGIYKYEVIKRIAQAMTLLDIEVADVVRLRHRREHGYPLWTLQFQNRELDRPEHLLDCVHWREHPDIDFPGQIMKCGEMFTAFASHANWTNNPTMFRTEFLRENILPRIGTGDAERDLQSWWQTTSAVVAQGEGLFTHYRID